MVLAGALDLGQFELGQFDLGQWGFFSTEAKKNLIEILFDLGQFFFRFWTLLEQRNQDGVTGNSTPRGQTKLRNNTTNKKHIGGGTNNIVRVFLVKTSPAEGRRRFHKNTAYARLGFRV